MSNDMHPDLEWLARNVSEWRYENLPYIEKDNNYLNSHCYGLSKEANSFTKSQWLQARKDLGLVMTDAEEELPAKEWASSITNSEEEAEMLDDMVNNPPHYTQGGIECIDAIRAALTPEEFRGYCKGNALKYIWREMHKGGDESMRKAVWYLNAALGDSQ